MTRPQFTSYPSALFETRGSTLDSVYSQFFPAVTHNLSGEDPQSLKLHVGKYTVRTARNVWPQSFTIAHIRIFTKKLKNMLFAPAAWSVSRVFKFRFFWAGACTTARRRGGFEWFRVWFDSYVIIFFFTVWCVTSAPRCLVIFKFIHCSVHVTLPKTPPKPICECVRVLALVIRFAINCCFLRQTTCVKIGCVVVFVT